MSSFPDSTSLISDLREQILFLKELGVDGLAAELPEDKGSGTIPQPPAATSRATESPVFEKAPPPESINIPKRSKETARQAGSRLAALPSLRTRRPAKEAPVSAPTHNEQDMPKKAVPTSENSPVLADVSPTLGETTDTIGSIRAEIGDCTRCKLSKLGRSQIVHTTGNFQAELMFVGEAPGADEDEQGLPFVGRAGKLLTDIIAAIGYTRDQVAIGNINRCRPPGNRKPEPEETAACRPFILREIAVIKPKVIVVLGATAAHNLLQVTTPISRLRGNFQDYFGVKVMPTFHPAYLLRDPHKKRDVWEDMKKVRDFLNSTSA